MSPARWGDLHTVGLSPKVYMPAIAQIAAALTSLVLGDAGAAKAIISTLPATFGVGYYARPSKVVAKGPKR